MLPYLTAFCTLYLVTVDSTSRSTVSKGTKFQKFRFVDVYFIAFPVKMTLGLLRMLRVQDYILYDKNKVLFQTVANVTKFRNSF